MKITESCSCGATFTIDGNVDSNNASTQVTNWRAQHRHAMPCPHPAFEGAVSEPFETCVVCGVKRDRSTDEIVDVQLEQDRRDDVALRYSDWADGFNAGKETVRRELAEHARTAAPSCPIRDCPACNTSSHTPTPKEQRS